MHKIFKIASLFSLLIVVACSTKKNTALSRTYHNTTSHYNVYFNGFESLKKGEKKIYKEIKDDYTLLLPVFPFSKEATSSAASDIDRTSKKATKVISLHSITAKPELSHGMVREEERKFYNKKEFNKWIDDSYFLIGKCHFNKGDFLMAIQTFRFIIKEYPAEKIIDETKIWLARSLIQSGDTKEGLEMIMSIKTVKLPTRLLSYYYAVYADAYIHDKKYNEAISMLEKAIKYERLIFIVDQLTEETKKTNKIRINSLKSYNSLPHKKMKVRFSFVLAQLFELTGDRQKAYNTYSKVIKMNPSYEIVFNATINRAGVFEEGQDDKAIRAQLKKMLSDSKNKEYRDQIYFALGNIDIKQNKKEDAINNYKLSASVSVSNEKQKSKSFLTLADIYYNDRKYLDASKYYDSTVILMDKSTPGYSKLRAKAKVLNKLSKSINNVILEDSLQLLAKLPESERNKVIDAVIETVKKEEEEKKKTAMEEMLQQQSNMELAQNMGTSAFGNSDASGNTKWYFYNPTNVSRGESEFKMRWGTRKLEDNWRRSNKGNVGSEDADADADEKSDAQSDLPGKKKKLSNKTREFYFEKIPLNDSMMQASHEKIKTSLFTAGEIYKDELNETKMSVPQYEQMIKRYPDDPMAVVACYTLYNLYRKMDNVPMSEHYRDMILSKYPESNYAKLLLNPDFIKELEAKEREVATFYDNTYKKYNLGNSQEVISLCDQAIAKWPKDLLVPKFSLLKSLAVGKSGDKPMMRIALESLVAKYPKTEEAQQAKEIIARIDIEHPEIEEKAQEIAVPEEKEKEIYFDSLPESTHFIGLLVPKEANMNQLSFNLINFNIDNYTSLTFDVKGEELNKKYNVVWIKSFKNKNDAKKYFENLSYRQEEVYKDVKTTSRMIFYISDNNQKTLIKDGSESRYMRFFKQTLK